MSLRRAPLLRSRAEQMSRVPNVTNEPPEGSVDRVNDESVIDKRLQAALDSRAPRVDAGGGSACAASSSANHPEATRHDATAPNSSVDGEARPSGRYAAGGRTGK